MSELIPVTKGSETIEVHPNALKEHLALGWKLVEEAVEEVEKLVKPPKKPAKAE